MANPYYGILRLRMIERKSVVFMSGSNGKFYKGLASDANQSFEVWTLPDGSMVVHVVSVYVANQQREAKPHPAAKLLQRFQKGDLIELQDRKFGPIIARLEKFDKNGAMELVPHNEAHASDRCRKLGEDAFIRLRLGSLCRYRARRVYANEIGKVTVRSREWPVSSSNEDRRLKL